MKKRELINLGITVPEHLTLAIEVCRRVAGKDSTKRELRKRFKALVRMPEEFLEDPVFGELANALYSTPISRITETSLRDDLTYTSWGRDIDPGAQEQMANACRLPISCRAALMPDAHVGYGLPIGGVLATKDAVIPYAVGVDIACRVMISVFDMPTPALQGQREQFAAVLERNTRFGVGANWKQKKSHRVLDADWSISPVTENLKDLAWAQLGTSGSGNHFVEFGEVEVLEETAGVPPGSYVAVVSHSGSRGPGSRVADHFSKLAQRLHPGLPKELRHLAWLPMEGEGAEYWLAMELMGEFASANHHVIHDSIIRDLGVDRLGYVENHHNFAWRETHFGEEVIVHRKGATPAGPGKLGYIPGTMVDPGFLVEGLGNKLSLESCSHGAGREMSRKRAKQTTTYHALRRVLADHNVMLLSAGLDEAPHAYKQIEQVMEAQSDLVKVRARFQPRIVKMAPSGERPED